MPIERQAATFAYRMGATNAAALHRISCNCGGDSEESEAHWRLAAQVPQYVYHQDDSTISRKPDGSLPYTAPAIAAQLDGRDVGHMEWFPTGDDSPLERGGEVSMIHVDPDFRRQGIGTGMFDWVRENLEPELRHIPTCSRLRDMTGLKLSRLVSPPCFLETNELSEYWADQSVVATS